MPITPTYPGVYVQEVPSGVRTIAGVSTSVALFIGRVARGPINQAVQCFSYTDFDRAFSSDTSVGHVPFYVRLFFQNGGTECWVIRIADGATAAQVTLQSEDGTEVLELIAKEAGLSGESIRAAVTYSGLQPEATFNLEIFRQVVDAAGNVSAADSEVLRNLSMDPNSSLYAPDYISQNSVLVDAVLAAAAPAPVNGFSRSGLPVPYVDGDGANFLAAWGASIGSTATTNSFNISVDGSRYITVDLADIDVTTINTGSAFADLAAAIEGAINAAFASAGEPGITVSVRFDLSSDAASSAPVPGPNATPNTATSVLVISSENQGDVFIRTASTADAAVALRLGTAQGGLEVSAHAARRPAPTGISLGVSNLADLRTLSEVQQGQLTTINLNAIDATGVPTTVSIPLDVQSDAADDPLWRGSETLLDKLQAMADAVNAYQQANPRSLYWRAELAGYRLTLVPTGGANNDTGTFATATTDISGQFTQNVRYYSVGVGGIAGLQTPALSAAFDGDPPTAADYDGAYLIAESDLDIFNLMILPPSIPTAVTTAELYGAASVFCQQQRAFLIMDPPDDWNSVQAATSGVNGLRVGLVADHSALYYPRITVNEAGRRINIGPAGAMAGLYARIDGTRGVWKAPAGTEATLRGVVALEQLFSDRQNGALNPRAINTLRVFPNGIVSWGSRTMDGDDDFGSEYKYVPIRRLALYIEESLYRGLKWVVFEPNDVALWAQIRLNVGTFMHDLFRKGAFQGQKPSDAYFVKCDSETTTQSDINLGIVNIWVGFAPLRPAEFVLLYLQQMAGQLQV